MLKNDTFRRWIVLHGAKLIKEAFNEPGFSGRDSKEAGKFIAGDTNGTLFAYNIIYHILYFYICLGMSIKG
jgi:hypothetical protein